MQGIQHRDNTRRLDWKAQVLLWAATLFLFSAVMSSSLWALQREIKAKARNYANAPIVVKQSRSRLVEIFSTPTQLAFSGTTGMKTKPSRVKYANRAGQLPSTYLLEGEALCQNKSRQVVEAVGLTVVLLDAFHQPIQPVGPNPYTVHQLPAQFPPSAERQFRWEEQVNSLDVFEVAVIVTRVRFADGTVWLAPEEELIDVF